MLHPRNYLNEMQKCSYCQFCQATCPVYLEDLLESHLARSRVNLIKACMVDGVLSISERFKEIVDRCLLCTNCTQSCPARIPVEEIVISTRYVLYNGKRKNIFFRNLLREFMKQRGFKGILSKASSVAKKIGIVPDELPPVASESFNSRYKGLMKAEAKGRAKVFYFVGCATNSFYPSTAEDVIKVLTRNGIDVIILDDVLCCGLPALSEGDIETAKELATKNYSILTELSPDAIITDCTSCAMTLKTKAMKVLEEKDPLRLKAELIAPKVWEATDYLNSVGLIYEPSSFRERVTYHIPCHRGFSQSLIDAPRKLIGRIPEAELVEMEFPERCCGAGGMFFIDNRELSEKIRAHKVQDIIQTRADFVMTQCPSCRSYLSVALKNHKFMHPISVIARAYGL